MSISIGVSIKIGILKPPAIDSVISCFVYVGCVQSARIVERIGGLNRFSVIFCLFEILLKEGSDRNEMFGVFLKTKLDIEAKLHKLQKDYIDLVRSPLLQNLNEENNLEAAKKLIEEKISNLESVKQELSSYLNQSRETSELLIEVSEASEAIESELDQLFEVLNLEIPEDLKHKSLNLAAETNPTESQPIPIEAAQDYLTEDESSEEEEDASDKENSRIVETKSDSDEYFSPNIQIRKSFKENNECYTPAVKSTSKINIFKR